MDYFSPTDDFRVLVHSATHDAPVLMELEPPRHFHFPPGWVSLVAAGAVLAATAGVQSEVQHVQALRAGHVQAPVQRPFGRTLHPRPEHWGANHP